ncbi:MAG: hypothetical protein ABIH65_04150 [Nanoarchaeota archaeon]
MPGKLMQFWEKKYKEENLKIETELKERGNKHGITQINIKSK